MEIIRQMQERKDLTERERNIRDYLMEHPGGCHFHDSKAVRGSFL